MTIRTTRWLLSVAGITSLLTAFGTAPATAAETEPTFVWTVTDTTRVATSTMASAAPSAAATSAPQPLTGSETAATRAVMEDDLKTECATKDEARTASGWTKDRFQQCFLGERTIDLRSLENGQSIAQIEIEYSLLAFAYDGQRRVDYVFSFDDFDTKGGEPLPATTLSVEFDGCGVVATCSPVLPSRTELVPIWKTAADRTVSFNAITPNNTGDGTYAIARALFSMNMRVVTTATNIVPWTELGMAESRVRFDSALSALGNGKFHGTVFSDHIPVIAFDRRATSDHGQEAQHIDQALNMPSLTFPSFAGKSVPGQGSRPLHRLMDATLRESNHAASQAICRNVWGSNYTAGGRECDEYPFQSVYEGSSTSTNGNSATWNGSARPIDGDHNGKGGTHLGNFYGLNRVLDENAGTPQEGTPADPFLVTVIS